MNFHNQFHIPHKQGSSRINQIISTVNPGGGTDAMAWARIASEYYLSNK